MNVAKQQTAVCLVGWTFNQKLKLAGNLSVAMFFPFFSKIFVFNQRSSSQV